MDGNQQSQATERHTDIEQTESNFAVPNNFDAGKITRKTK